MAKLHKEAAAHTTAEFAVANTEELYAAMVHIAHLAAACTMILQPSRIYKAKAFENFQRLYFYLGKNENLQPI